jgi:hypothetical protein
MGYHKWLSRNRMVLTYIALPIPRHGHGVCTWILQFDCRFQISDFERCDGDRDNKEQGEGSLYPL